MAKLQELDTYFLGLETSLKSGEKSYDSNSDRAHNAKIMQLMFRYCDNISMFCGSMSIFGKEFENHLERDYGTADAKTIMFSFNNAFRFFLEKEGTKLSIIVENFDEIKQDEIVSKEFFARYIESGKIVVSKLNDELAIKEELNHYAIGDNKIVRLEDDKIIHNGVCGINDTQLCNIAQENFNKLLPFANNVKFY